MQDRKLREDRVSLRRLEGKIPAQVKTSQSIQSACNNTHMIKDKRDNYVQTIGSVTASNAHVPYRLPKRLGAIETQGDGIKRDN